LGDLEHAVGHLVEGLGVVEVGLAGGQDWSGQSEHISTP